MGCAHPVRSLQLYLSNREYLRLDHLLRMEIEEWCCDWREIDPFRRVYHFNVRYSTIVSDICISLNAGGHHYVLNTSTRKAVR